jgi:hypothetical protein
MKTLALVAALSLAGCKKNGPDCAKAIDKSMELSKAEMQGVDGKMIQKMKDVGVQHCRDDNWPAEVLDCMSDATTMTASQACYGMLSPEQQQKMNRAAMEMMTPAAATGSAGSATGSAGSAAPPL